MVFSRNRGVFLPIDDTGHLNCLLCQCCKASRIYICSVRTKRLDDSFRTFFFPSMKPNYTSRAYTSKNNYFFSKLIQIIIIAVGPEVGRKLHKVLLHFFKRKTKCNEYYLLPNSYLLKTNFYKRYVSYQIKVVFIMDLIS